MRSVESEGENIDEAIENALRTLQVRRDQAEIEILTDATRGLFGFGGTKARVRATVRVPLASLDDSRETFIPAASERPPAPPDPSVARSRAILSELLSHLGVSATVESRPGDEPGVVVLEVNG